MLARDLQLTPGPQEYLASASQGPPAGPPTYPDWDQLYPHGPKGVLHCRSDKYKLYVDQKFPYPRWDPLQSQSDSPVLRWGSKWNCMDYVQISGLHLKILTRTCGTLVQRGKCQSLPNFAGRVPSCQKARSRQKCILGWPGKFLHTMSGVLHKLTPGSGDYGAPSHC